MTRAVSNAGMGSGLKWPNPQDYQGSMQHPELAFSDKRLQQIRIRTDKLNMPRALAGAFANVYQGTLPDGTDRAIRVFISAMPERQQRLEAVANYLKTCSLKCLVDFTYDNRGIRSWGDGKRYPLVTMEWVRGDTLYDWVREQCLTGKGRLLDHVCESWVETIDELTGAKIAHGDLQHGNVMIATNGQPKIQLVDYDCMCVPGMTGLKNLELGVDPYQHPRRDESTVLSPELDNFSAIFIFAALRALAVRPKLWDTYVEKPTLYDKLLFRREDLDAPQTSSLMCELSGSPDPVVQNLSRDLAEFTRIPMNQVPSLGNALFTWDTVKLLLSKKQFDNALDLVTRSRKTLKDAPRPLLGGLQNAQQRIQQRKALEKAVQAGDEAAMQRLYVPALLDDYAGAKSAVAAAKLAARVVPLLKQLKDAEKAEKWREFVRIWDKGQALLAKRPSARPLATLVESWRERNVACDRVLTLVKQPKANPAELEAAWDALEQLGGHPEAEPHRARLQTVLQRQRAWAELCGAGETLSDDTDETLIAVWDKHRAIFANWDVARPYRQRVDQARQRLGVVRKLEQQADNPMTMQGEQTIVKAGDAIETMCAGYSYRLSSRVEQARLRVQALQRLLNAVATSASDVSIVKAYR